jgi:hypothetical protein
VLEGVDPVHVRGKPAAGPFDAVTHLAVGKVHVGSLLELKETPGAPGLGDRCDPVDPADRAQLLFQGLADLLQHLARRRVAPGDIDGEKRGSETVREELDRDGDRGHRSHHQRGGEEDHDRDAAIQGEAGESGVAVRYLVGHGKALTNPSPPG